MRGTLAARIALATAGAVAGAGVVVAVVTAVLADGLLRAREDAQLVAAARTLALELEEPGADPIWIAEDETRELAHTGIRVAVYDGARRVSGDAAVAAVGRERCETLGPDRVCSVPAGRWTATVARTVSAAGAREALALAAGIAVVITTLLGALAALALTRAVLAPLDRLRAAVARVPEDRPGSADLGGNEGVAEVDAVREALRTALARLDASMDQSRRFSRDAAHELRTPLTTILGELELAAEQPDDREHVARARKVAERLAVLLERLLILSRLDPSQDLLEDVALLEVLEDARDALPAAWRARVIVEGADVVVRGDRALLLALVANALENALKFSSDVVRLELTTEDDRARLAIVDRGPGIAADERARVFAPFYRSPGARASGVPGHGIGLALIRHVVELHRGEARFADVERGARLEIALPRA